VVPKYSSLEMEEALEYLGSKECVLGDDLATSSSGLIDE
jgi:hypothetical protein